MQLTEPSLVISPHYDDAVYSCWMAVDRASTVLTVFGGAPGQDIVAPWDISTGFTSANAAIEARKKENSEALSASDARIINLDFVDVEYRQLGVAPKVTAEDVIAGIRIAVESHRTTYAPLGFGFTFRHVDHGLVREATKVLAREGADIIYYADIPYAMAMGVENWPQRLPYKVIRDLLGREIEIEIIELTSRQQQQKRESVRLYTSQYEQNNTISGRPFDHEDAFRWEVKVHPVK